MRLQQKHINLGLLVLGFGLGQGSLFLSNTYLYWGGQFQLVAEFGAANALLTFWYFVADWGGLVYLAKESVVARKGQRSTGTSYLALSLVRLVVALTIYLGLIIYQSDRPSGFLQQYCTFAGLGLLAYAFNAGGLLDGQSKAGVSGLTQALPIVGVAVALPFCVKFDLMMAGKVLGIVYALGMVGAIGLQLRAAHVDWHAAYADLTMSNLWKVGKESVPYMLTPLPGHALFRAQVLLATMYLQPQLVALFIYARQIVGIGYQGLGFYLRVDLRDFAEQLMATSPKPMRMLLTSITVRMGAIGTIGLMLVAAALWPFKPEIARSLMVYAPCILAVAIAATLQRAMLLQSQATETVVILSIATILPFAFIWPVFDTSSIISLVLIEFIGLALQSALFTYRWSQSMAQVERQ